MSVYVIGAEPLPSIDTMDQYPCDRLDDGPSGWTRFQRTNDGGPNAGLVLCRTKDGAWVFKSPDDKSDNGIWCVVQGAIAAYNPQPSPDGPKAKFFALEIPNA